jgi:hypothetical protein
MLMSLDNVHRDLIVGDKDNPRDSIVQVEEFIKTIPGALIGDNDECPLVHSFSDGIYVRQISIPKGFIIVGKIHKHDHPNFLLSGTVHVFTEGNLQETLVAPCSMISPAGTKRTLYAETDLVWTTIHNNPTNTRALDELESDIIAGSFLEYDEFKTSKDKRIEYVKKNTRWFRVKEYLIKILQK